MNTPDHAAPMSHQLARELLPWLLAGTLDDAALAQVQGHLQACAQCRAELEWQSRLSVAADADRAYAKLAPRLGPQAPSRFGVNVLGRWRAITARSPWLGWTALTQLAVIGILGVLLGRPGSETADVRAAGGAAQSRQLMVRFKPATSEREIHRILQANGARVVAGPAVSDAYILALPASQAYAALDRMRAEPAVALVQLLSSTKLP